MTCGFEGFCRGPWAWGGDRRGPIFNAAGQSYPFDIHLLTCIYFSNGRRLSACGENKIIQESNPRVILKVLYKNDTENATNGVELYCL